MSLHENTIWEESTGKPVEEYEGPDGGDRQEGEIKDWADDAEAWKDKEPEKMPDPEPYY